MSIMISELYDALLSAGADETKAREAAKAVAQYDKDTAEIKASLGYRLSVSGGLQTKNGSTKNGFEVSMLFCKYHLYV